MTEPRKYSHSDMGFGDVQTNEEDRQDLNQPVSPVAPVIPTIAPPSLPKAAVPTAPPLPRPPKSENAADIMPPLPPTPSIVQNPVNQENAKVLGEYGLGAAALTTLLASLPFIYRKVAGENPPPATGPELTINPSAPTEPVVEKPVQTIRSRSFSPAEQYVAENINKQYPFTFEEAKKGLGLEGVKVTSPQEAEIVANQYAKQLQAQAAASQPAAAPAAEIPTVVPTEAAAPAVPESIESKLGKPTLTTGSGMPAYEGQGPAGSKVKHKDGNIASLNDVPKNMVFVPGGQNMDIVRNAVGQPEYTAKLKSSGGYPVSPQAAYEQSREINKSLGRVSNAEAKAAGIAPPEPTPSITQKIGGLKTVRLAGATGALILASDLANAAVTGESPLASTAEGFTSALKSKDYGMAASHAAELLNLHPVGMLANALFGTSPEELKTLRSAEQARKVGAGRGIAPPSAYQR